MKMSGGQRLFCGVLAIGCFLTRWLPFAAIHLPLIELPIVGISAVALSRYVGWWIGLCSWLAALLLIGAVLGSRGLALSGAGLALLFSLVFAIGLPGLVNAGNIRFLLDNIGALGRWVMEQAGLDTASFSREAMEGYARLVASQMRLGLGFWLYLSGMALSLWITAGRQRQKSPAETAAVARQGASQKRPGSSPF